MVDGATLCHSYCKRFLLSVDELLFVAARQDTVCLHSNTSQMLEYAFMSKIQSFPVRCVGKADSISNVIYRAEASDTTQVSC